MRKIKNLISVLCMALMFSFAIGTIVKVATPTTAFASDGRVSDEQGPTASNGMTAADLATKGEQAINSTTAGLVKICLALCPLALVVCVMAILITHDPRKISGLIGTCITIVIVTLVVLLINAGTLMSILEDIANYFK